MFLTQWTIFVDGRSLGIFHGFWLCKAHATQKFDLLSSYMRLQAQQPRLEAHSGSLNSHLTLGGQYLVSLFTEHVELIFDVSLLSVY